jgi:hypothetical protein
LSLSFVLRYEKDVIDGKNAAPPKKRTLFDC